MKYAALLCIALLAAACTRVETGEVGLVKTFSGTVEPNPLYDGLYQSLTKTVYVFSSKEIIVPVKNLTPQTKDKLKMDDVDISYGYYVVAKFIPELYIHYGPSAHREEGREIYPMAVYVNNLMNSAINDAIARYDALDVNNNRDAIQKSILEDVRAKIVTEGLDGKVVITQAIITRLAIPQSVVQSATAIVTAQNDLQTKKIELQQVQVDAQKRVTTAQGEAQAIKAQTEVIAAQGGAAYLQLKAIERWNGQLPWYTGGGGPLPFLSIAQPPSGGK